MTAVTSLTALTTPHQTCGACSIRLSARHSGKGILTSLQPHLSLPGCCLEFASISGNPRVRGTLGKVKTEQTQGGRSQASGHQRIVPQSSEVLEHPSSVGKNTAFWLRGEKRIQMLQGFVVWASSHQKVLVSPATG